MTVSSSAPTDPVTPPSLPSRRDAGAPSRGQRFITLMRREWLQHRIGWWVVMCAPTALIGLMSLFDRSVVQVRLDDESFVAEGLHQAPALLQVLLLGLGVTFATVLLALLSVGFQLPGLARRDEQDRSIEFWRSMPTSHRQSLGAMLLMHLLVLPWLALAAGLVGSQIAALIVVAGTHGVGAWLSLPWLQILVGGLALALRAAWGLLLALLWLSPLILLTMAASAWFKRWGVPLVVAAVLAGWNLLDPRLPQPWVKLTLERLRYEAGHALMTSPPLKGAQIATPDHIAGWLPQLPGWAVRDGATALGHLASPVFVLALALAAAAFGLLLLRRRAA